MAFGVSYRNSWGACMAQSVEHTILAQVMISWSVVSSPASESVLTAQSLESVLDSVSPSLSLSQKYISIKKLKKQRNSYKIDGYLFHVLSVATK